MAVKLLQVLVLGVIAAAAGDDVPVTWVPSPRTLLSCQVPDAERIQLRRPPPPLEGEEKRRKLFIWRRDGVELKRFFSNTPLEVSRRKDSDGVYQCAVQHQGGEVLGYPVHLKFAYIEKQFSMYPANNTAWRGQPYVLMCGISSGPPAAISWLRDGEPLPEDGRYHLLNNQLIITQVKDEDAGLYRCRATNAYANKSRTSHGGRLQVEDAPEDLKTAFLPIHWESTMLVSRGSQVVLPCPVVGNPKPVLIWELTPPGTRTGELESMEELLVMPTIEVDQEGVYVCRVEGNKNLVRTFNVTIALPVNITHPPESKQVVTASTVRFNCTASGNPPPKVTWYKDGNKLKLSGRIEVVPSVDDKSLLQLLIRSVTSRDAGVYQCFATAKLGMKSAWATLNVTGGEAAAPRDVKCWPAGARDVALRWSPVKDVVAYTVQYTRPDGISLPWQPMLSSDTVINVKSPLTPYGFQVRAYIHTATSPTNQTATLVSEMSETVTCQGQGVPIKLTKVGEELILVSWQSFFDENPGIVQWILQYKTENSSDEHNITLDGHFYNHTLNLSPEMRSLQVRVLGSRTVPWLRQDLSLVPWTSTSSAGDDLGLGEVRVVPEDVEVTEINPRNFTVRWHCKEEGLPQTYSYMVCTRKVGGDDDCFESYVKWARILYVQPASAYEVRVQARLPERALAGDFSAPLHVTTPEDDQRDFRDLTYKYINTTTIRVSWKGDHKEYTVRYSSDFIHPLNQWMAVEAVGNTVLLTGIDPMKNLSVLVNENGPLGHSAVLTIPAQIPGTPLSIKNDQERTTPESVNETTQPSTTEEAKDIQYTYTRGGITVTWKGRGPRVVRYSQNLTLPVGSWHSINVTNTRVQITDLDPTRSTFVMVVAPGPNPRSKVLTIMPRPPESSNVYLIIGIGCGVLMLCLLGAVAICIWHKRKRSRSPITSRRRHSSPNDMPEGEGSEMKKIGDRLANGGGSKDAGEPLLNGHVHITENPTQSKIPNGKVLKGQHYEAAFDVSRYDDDTLETVLDPDSTTYHLLDTSRRPEYDAPPSHDYNKLPDDNMNSELTRSDVQVFQLDNSKVLPTLQPNG